jgi:hypothetical protein
MGLVFSVPSAMMSDPVDGWVCQRVYRVAAGATIGVPDGRQPGWISLRSRLMRLSRAYCYGGTVEGIGYFYGARPRHSLRWAVLDGMPIG